MDNTQQVTNFVRSLKAAIEAGAMYFFEHPIFLESAERLRTHIEDMLETESPLRIGFTPSAIMFGKTLFEDQQIYQSLAHDFHMKKIKLLTVEKGITKDNLKDFLTIISQTPKELIKKGGIKKLIEEKSITHLQIEEIDYTELLYGEGEECEDVWTYLLSDAVEKNNTEAINKYVQNFEEIMKRFKVHNVIEDDEASKNLEQFMTFLQENEEGKYKECAKQILRSAVKDSGIKEASNVKQLNTFIKNLETDELADTLWDEIISEDSVDQLNLNLFSQLLDSEKNEKVVSSLQQKMDQNNLLLQAPRVRNRIKDLFSTESASMIPKSYHHFLTTALEKISTVGTVKYDKTHAKRNYWFILASLTSSIMDDTQAIQILECVTNAWEEIQTENNLMYIFDLHRSLSVAQNSLEDKEILAQTQALTIEIEEHIETLICEGRISIDEFDTVIPNIKKETQQIENFYNKFFNENKVNPFTLKLLYFLSRDNIQIFYYHLEQKARDLNFMRKTVDLAKTLPIETANELLNTIYTFSGQFMKIKVLQEMRILGLCNQEIVLPLLKKAPYNIKFEALKVALKNDETHDAALKTLLSLKSFFGINNSKIRAHIKIISFLNVEEARPYIEKLAQYKFFWSASVRKDAIELLERWDEQ